MLFQFAAMESAMPRRIVQFAQLIEAFVLMLNAITITNAHQASAAITYAKVLVWLIQRNQSH
jgi:hypothetical protein